MLSKSDKLAIRYIPLFAFCLGLTNGNPINGDISDKINNQYLDTINYDFSDADRRSFEFINFYIPTGLINDSIFNFDHSKLLYGSDLTVFLLEKNLFEYKDRKKLHLDVIKKAVAFDDLQGVQFEDKLQLLGIGVDSSLKSFLTNTNTVADVLSVYWDTKTVISFTANAYDSAKGFNTLSSATKAAGKSLTILTAVLDVIEVSTGIYDSFSVYTMLEFGVRAQIASLILDELERIDIVDRAFYDAINEFRKDLNAMADGSKVTAMLEALADNSDEIKRGVVSVSGAITAIANLAGYSSLVATAILGIIQVEFSVISQWEHLRRAAIAGTVYRFGRDIYDNGSRTQGFLWGRLQSSYLYFMHESLNNFRGTVDDVFERLMGREGVKDRFELDYSAMLQSTEVFLSRSSNSLPQAPTNASISVH